MHGLNQSGRSFRRTTRTLDSDHTGPPDAACRVDIGSVLGPRESRSGSFDAKCRCSSVKLILMAMSAVPFDSGRQYQPIGDNTSSRAVNSRAGYRRTAERSSIVIRTAAATALLLAALQRELLLLLLLLLLRLPLLTPAQRHCHYCTTIMSFSLPASADRLSD